MTARRQWLEKDYYSILGVERSAPAREIKKAYRKLAQKYHPDNNPGDSDAETRFKEISEAHAVLSNPETRREYDQTRDAFARGAYAGGPGGSTQYVTFEDIGDLGDLLGGGGFFGGFSDLFDRTGRGTGPRQGGDLDAEVRLSFHEAVQGTTRTLTIDGAGERREVKVKIPPGIADGGRVRLRGKGRPGTEGGPPGDLYVTVHTGGHPIFERSGADLRVRVPISYTEAALGANITAPTLDGKVTLKVPPGTPSGKTFRVTGKGGEGPSGRGDLLVTVDVTVPDELSPEARSLLEQLRDIESDQNPRAHLGV